LPDAAGKAAGAEEESKLDHIALVLVDVFEYRLLDMHIPMHKPRICRPNSSFRLLATPPAITPNIHRRATGLAANDDWYD
jgi:hypothetical protein